MPDFISIHAPRAGCDGERMARILRYGYFNPRTPCGVRQMIQNSPGLNLIFQSTHPVRGATWYKCKLWDFRRISIHAPRAGCDHFVIQRHKFCQRISIHAPRAGCDRHTGQCCVLLAISIHAPRAGCDTMSWASTNKWRHFNPRTPCGVRLSRSGGKETWHENFNPRTPCGVRRGWDGVNPIR